MSTSHNLDEPVTLTRGALHGLLRVMLYAGGLRAAARIGESPTVDLSLCRALAEGHPGQAGDVLREELAEVEARYRREYGQPTDEDLAAIPRTEPAP